MNYNNLLQPGIKEAVKKFWETHDNTTPRVIKDDHDRLFINTCLLLALGTLNSIVKELK